MVSKNCFVWKYDHGLQNRAQKIEHLVTHVKWVAKFHIFVILLQTLTDFHSVFIGGPHCSKSISRKALSLLARSLENSCKPAGLEGFSLFLTLGIITMITVTTFCWHQPSGSNNTTFTGWSKKNGPTLHFPKYLENYWRYVNDFLHTSRQVYAEHAIFTRILVIHFMQWRHLANIEQ